jgi:hypothetical protein
MNMSRGGPDYAEIEFFSLAKGEDFRYTLKTMGVTLDLMRGIRT